MNKAKYNEILLHINELSNDDAKIKYLDEEIETTDNDRNGFNDELIDMLNKLREKKHNHSNDSANL
jgi:hypothetical protein